MRRRQRFAIAMCAALFGWSASFAASAAASTSPSETFEHIARTALATRAAPGIALAVVRGNRIAFEGGFGEADLVRQIHVTAQTRFAIGSLTKQFTAVATLMLVGEKKLSLDGSIARYLPTMPNAKRITPRMLLNQTSGLHNYPATSEHPWPMHGRIPLARIIAILSTDKPDFSPGDRFEYSNANYAALAAIIEKVSGKSYAKFLQLHIFVPLHMTDTGFGYDAQQNAPVAVGYIGTQAKLPPLSLDLFSGAGGLVSSAHDLALWDIALLDGTLLSKTQTDLLWQPGRTAAGAPTIYGMGFVPSTLGGHREVWHNGLAPDVGGYCYNALLPHQRLAVVVLTNGFGASGVPERMTNNIAAAYGLAPQPAPLVIATSAPNDNPKIDTLARTFWNQLAAGTPNSALLTRAFAAKLTPAFTMQIAQGIVLLGTLEHFTFVGMEQSGAYTLYRYSLSFVGSEHLWAIAVTPNGKIAGSRLLK